MNTKTIGNIGEDIAISFLNLKEYKILEKNYRFKHEEIDIIAKNKNNTICFIEVKIRFSENYGSGKEAVNLKKQKSILKVATAYLKYNIKNIDTPCRFDVINILISEDKNKMDLEHIQSAFIA